HYSPTRRSSDLQHGVDDVDHAIGLDHVGNGDIGNGAVLVGDGDLAVGGLEGQLAATHRVNDMLATIGLDHADDVGRQRLGGNDVAGEDRREHLLVFRHEQRVDRAGGQGVKRGIDRGQYGEGAFAGQRFDQASSLDGGDKRRVVGRVDGILDNVLVGIHGGAADFGIVLGDSAADRGDGQHGGGGEGAERESHCLVLPVFRSHCSAGTKEATEGGAARFRCFCCYISALT